MDTQCCSEDKDDLHWDLQNSTEHKVKLEKNWAIRRFYIIIKSLSIASTAISHFVSRFPFHDSPGPSSFLSF